MAEHRIRLRGAWELTTLGPASGLPERKALPTIWSTDPGSPFLLVRHFGRPPIDPGAEGIHLELLEMSGLVAIRLNGQDLGRPTEGIVRRLLPIQSPLRARNSLELEIDFRSVDPRVLLEEWGKVALVISPMGSPPD